MTLIVENPADLVTHQGAELGPTEWMMVTQDRVDRFANAIDDHQWIHVDPARAKQGQFGGTIAHGFLTLSLVSKFYPNLIDVRDVCMAVNYGCNKVRFPEPVRTGARIRGTGKITKVEEVKGGIQSTVRITIEIEGEKRPACVVDSIHRYYP